MFLINAGQRMIRLASRQGTGSLRAPRRPHRRLALEQLEGRLCPSGSYLFVSSLDTNSVLRFDENTGAFVDAFVPTNSGGLRQPTGLIFGPDHNLYVGSGLEADNGNGTGHRDVLRYNGASGAFIDDFADSNQLQSPRAVLFGPDGNLYVADGFANTIVRYNGTTGAFIDDFVPAGSGGLRSPTAMVFGPDGSNDGKLDLYVGEVFDRTILRYDGTTGAFKGVFVASGSGGLNNVQGLVFGPDGNLYVESANVSNTGTFPPGSVLRFQGPGGSHPGAFIDTFVPAGSGGLSTPFGGLLFGPDGKSDGKLDLYVTSVVASFGPANGKVQFVAAPGTSEVLRYDGTTGAFLSTFVTPDSGGLQFPTFMTFTETNPTTLNYVTPSAPGSVSSAPAVRTASAITLASLASGLVTSGQQALPAAPLPGPGTASTPPARQCPILPTPGASSSAHPEATDAVFAVSHIAANEDGDWLFAPLFSNSLDEM